MQRMHIGAGRRPSGCGGDLARRATPSPSSAAAAAAANAAAAAHRRPPPPLAATRRAVLAAASTAPGDYSFADSVPDRAPGERRNRTREKKAQAELSAVVRGLVAMTAKQLSAVGHLLDDEVRAELALAARLPRSNQGRKRHENRAAQLLRAGAPEAALAKLAEAVRLAEASAQPFDDAEAAALVDAWVRGLKAGDDVSWMAGGRGTAGRGALQ